jgi:hypothetical protein
MCSYSKLADRAKIMSQREDFNLFIIAVIMVAGLLVGLQTYDGMEVERKGEGGGISSKLISSKLATSILGEPHSMPRS